MRRLHQQSASMKLITLFNQIKDEMLTHQRSQNSSSLLLIMTARNETLSDFHRNEKKAIKVF